LYRRVYTELNSQHHDLDEYMNECRQLVDILHQTYPMLNLTNDINVQLQVTSQFMIQAHESNIELHRHMTRIIEHLKLLHLSTEQFEQELPMITAFNGRKYAFETMVVDDFKIIPHVLFIV
jgi:hypothetical protein